MSAARPAQTAAGLSSIRFETQLWLAQRMSAVVLALCVLVHLVTIIVVTRHGLSGPEILARLRAAPGWSVFYLVFVISVAVHAPIGLRAIAIEWLRWQGRSLNAGVLAVGLLLFVLGVRAIVGVFGGPA